MTLPLISLDEIKEFCRIDDDLDAASAGLLEGFREAAIDAGEHITNRDWCKKWTAETFPASLKIWTLNRVAAMHEIRSDIQDLTYRDFIKMPRNHVDALLDRWVIYGGRRRCQH